MTMPIRIHLAHAAILMLAEVKTATEAFDRGDTNVFEAVDAITDAIEAYRSAARSDTRRDAA